MNFGYWVFGRDMGNVNLSSLKSRGVTDLFLNYYAFNVHSEKKVVDWIKKAESNNIRVHIWVQSFYEGKWINPVKTDMSYKIKEIVKYSKVKGVSGIHLDYLRFPSEAYKVKNGSKVITDFVRNVKKSIPKDMILSCAVMSEKNTEHDYGQNISDLGKIVDMIIPMSYKGNYKGDTNWLSDITKYFTGKATIWSGLQSYKSDDNPVVLSKSELSNDIKTCLNNNAKGVVLFRYGLSTDVDFKQFNSSAKVSKEKNMVSYKEILSISKTIKDSVEKNQKIPTVKGYSMGQLCYILGKAVKSPGKSVTGKSSVKDCADCTGTGINRKLKKGEYQDVASRLVSFIDKNGKLPNYTSFGTAKISNRLNLYCFAKIIVWYSNNKNALPNTCLYDNGVFTVKKTTTTSTSNSKKTTTSTNSNCANPYTSTPHHTQQGAGYLGQTNPYRCGPHSLMQGFRKFGWDLSESKLASVAGTTTAGTSHNGLETAIAWVAKQKNVKLTAEWRNFSSFGKTDAERFEEIGKIACKANKFVVFHIGYEDSGSSKGDETFGHYEKCDKYNVKTKYVRALNSLGSRQGEGYLGHLQDRSFSLQSYYISNISQKSVLIVTKG